MNRKKGIKPLSDLFWPLGLYLTLWLLYLFAIPSGESPDEPGHLVCVQQVAQLYQLPVVDPAPTGEVWWDRENIVSGRMCYHMPLYYLMGGVWYRATAVLFQEPLLFEFPPSNPAGPTPAMFLHTDKTHFWHLPEPTHLVMLRLFSLGLGLVMVWGCYRVAAYWTSEERGVMTFSAVLAAGWPQFVYASRAVTNDALATALAVVLFCVLLDVGKPGRFWLTGLLTSFIHLTKLSLSFTLVVVLIVWLAEYGVLRQFQRRYLVALAGCGCCWAATCLLLYLHPVLRQHVIQTFQLFSGVSPQAQNGRYWLDVLALTASSGWARFGWMNVAAPIWQVYVWWVGVLGTAVWGGYHLWGKKSTTEHRLRLFITAVWVIGILLSYLRINLSVFQPQFRFAFALIPVLTSFSAVGTFAVGQAGQKGHYLAAALVALLLWVSNVWVIWAIVAPAYGWS